MNNIFEGAPFGGRGPALPGPGKPFPVVNGTMPQTALGQVPTAPGFIPMGPPPAMAPRAAQMAPAAPQAPRPLQAAPKPQTPGSIPIGSKADCPVCRPFGRR